MKFRDHLRNPEWMTGFKMGLSLRWWAERAMWLLAGVGIGTWAILAMVYR